MRPVYVGLLSSALFLAACAPVLVVESEPPPSPRPLPPAQAPARQAALKVPPGHLPRPGQCRVWIPGRPPGHQPRPGSCERVRRHVPPGAWVLYRALDDRQWVRVSVYDQARPRVVAVRYYDVATGEFLYQRGL